MKKYNFTKEDIMNYTGMSATEYHTQYQRYWRLNRRIERSGLSEQEQANIPSAILAHWRSQQENPTGLNNRMSMFDEMRESLRYVRDPDKFKVGYTDIRTQVLRERWGDYNDIKLNVDGKEVKVNINEAFALYKRGDITLDQYKDAIAQLKQSDQFINYESKK